MPPIQLQQEFTDRAGERWSTEIIGDVLMRCEDELEVNVLDMLDFNSELFRKYNSSPRFAIQFLYTALHDQIRQRELSPEEFARRIDGRVLRDAFEAFVAGAIHFSQDPDEIASKTEVFAAMKESGKELMRKLMEPVRDGTFRSAIAEAVASIDGSSRPAAS